jgi:hypothetical protein
LTGALAFIRCCRPSVGPLVKESGSHGGIARRLKCKDIPTFGLRHARIFMRHPNHHFIRIPNRLEHCHDVASFWPLKAAAPQTEHPFR